MTTFEKKMDRLYTILKAAVVGVVLAALVAFGCLYDPCEWCPEIFHEMAE